GAVWGGEGLRDVEQASLLARYEESKQGCSLYGRLLWWPWRLTNWNTRSLPSPSFQVAVVTRLIRCVSVPPSRVTTLTITCCPFAPLGKPSATSSGPAAGEEAVQTPSARRTYRPAWPWPSTNKSPPPPPPVTRYPS